MKLRNFFGDAIYRLDEGESDIFQTETCLNREALLIRLNIICHGSKNHLESSFGKMFRDRPVRSLSFRCTKIIKSDMTRDI